MQCKMVEIFLSFARITHNLLNVSKISTIYNHNKSVQNYNQMDKKIIKVVIIIVLFFSLVGQCFTRRTGQNSNHDGSNDKNWNIFSWITRRHGKAQSKKQKSSFFGKSINFMKNIFSCMWKFMAVLIVKLARQLNQMNQQNTLKEQQITIFEQFKEACLIEPSVYNHKEQEAIIQDIKENIFVMNVQTKDGLLALNSRLNISSINRMTDVVYSVSFEGSDELNRCCMDGYLGFTKGGFQIRLVKSYEIQLPTEQTDNGQKLIFQGFGNIAEVQGQWLQIGHQNDNKYSGIWNWVSQTQQQ